MGKVAALNVQRMKLSDLSPHPENPRLHSTDQLRRLQQSLENFGYSKGSIVVNSAGVILAGHGMYESVIEEGYDEADVVVADLPEGKAEAFMVADNRLGDLSEWDMIQLNTLMTELQEMDIELEEMGFISSEFDKEVPDFSPVDGEGQPKLDSKKPVICPECGHEFVPKD